MEDSNINNNPEGQEPVSDITVPDATAAGDQPKDDQPEEDKYKDVPFDKHPRWKELREEQADLKAKLESSELSNQQLAETISRLDAAVESLAGAKTPQQQNDALEDLRKLQASSVEKGVDLTELADKLYKYNLQRQKAEEESARKEQEKTLTQSQEQTVKQLQSQLDDLVKSDELKDEEVMDFAKWSADKLQETGDKRYENFYSALPRWRASQEESAKAAESKSQEKEEKINRSGVGASGGEKPATINVSLQDMGGVSLKNAMQGKIK